MSEVGNFEASKSLKARSYLGKEERYFRGARHDFLSLLPLDGRSHVLEIGCGAGETGRVAISTGRCRSYVGVELVPHVASLARRHLDEVIEGDVEQMQFPWPDESFDALLLSEVLEHLVDPWLLLKRLAPKLRRGGLVFASSPNVSQISVILGLLADRWDLSESGVMDRTHLRWFTRQSYRIMFEQAGFVVDDIRALGLTGRMEKVFNLLTIQKLRHLTIRQILLIGRRG